jgi:hypothetical protein
MMQALDLGMPTHQTENLPMSASIGISKIAPVNAGRRQRSSSRRCASVCHVMTVSMGA